MGPNVNGPNREWEQIVMGHSTIKNPTRSEKNDFIVNFESKLLNVKESKLEKSNGFFINKLISEKIN